MRTDLIPYIVTGVLCNPNVSIAEATGIDVSSDVYDIYPFSTEINTIGYDWKEYDFSTSTYIIEDSLAYFVKRANGEIWKLIFTGFGGSASGDFMFTKEEVATVGLQENNIDVASFGIYPNLITENYIAQIIFNTDYNYENTAIIISSLDGINVEQLNIPLMKTGINQFSINTTYYERGVYIATIYFEGKMLSQKFIVQ